MPLKLPSWLVFFLAFLALTGCKKTVNYNLDLKTDYFPLKLGHSVLYEVDTVHYNALFNTGKDTVYWEVRETIIDTFHDLEGRKVYKFERSKRKPGQLDFRPDLIGTRLIDGSRAEELVDNVRFVPLVFPPTEGQSWEGNSYITITDSMSYYEDWEYSILKTDTAVTINGLNFPEALKVEEVNQEDLLTFKHSTAIYARDAGLVERRRYNLWFVGSNIPIGEEWEEKATNGFITHWRVLSVN